MYNRVPIVNSTIKCIYKFVRRVDLTFNVLITYKKKKKQRDTGNLKMMDASVTLIMGLCPSGMQMSKCIKLDI